MVDRVQGNRCGTKTSENLSVGYSPSVRCRVLCKKRGHRNCVLSVNEWEERRVEGPVDTLVASLFSTK